MAERRMVAKKIILSDDFHALPSVTQLLYVNLCAAADDDGFLGDHKGIAQNCKATADDVKRLVKAGYLIRFRSGIIAIRHWRVHNQIRKDRYHTTFYQEEFKTLTIDELGIYRELPKQTPVSSNTSLATEVRIGKERLEQISREQNILAICASRAEIEKRLMDGTATPDDFERYRIYCQGGFNTS